MTEQTKHWQYQDLTHCWHPFTDQGNWEATEPLILVSGKGCWLTDSNGCRYLDGNSSIWTNIHGHNHPRLNQALHSQFSQVAHTSYLGFGNPRASELALALASQFPPGELDRVFFSDNGSTAIEVALKMSLQYRHLTGQAKRDTVIAFYHAYHGDTLGAASTGGVARFANSSVPYGYKVQHLENADQLDGHDPTHTTAVILEPLVQGVNEIRPWPKGMLRTIRKWCTAHNVHLILDEVLTGFGRTGKMFACQHEHVIPDFLCLAKGLTGGYLPMAATLTHTHIYQAFKGGSERTFYYGHSYTANQLGCALALASLRLFTDEHTLENVSTRSSELSSQLQALQHEHPCVSQIRQIGLIAGIQLAHPDGTPYPPENLTGARVCMAARKHGLLTRPINDTIVIIPPLCINQQELLHLTTALSSAITDSSCPLAN